MKQILVGVWAVFFLVDERVQRRMLGCQFLDRCLVHRRRPFLVASDSINKSRFRRFVSPDHAARQAAHAVCLAAHDEFSNPPTDGLGSRHE